MTSSAGERRRPDAALSPRAAKTPLVTWAPEIRSAAPSVDQRRFRDAHRAECRHGRRSRPPRAEHTGGGVPGDLPIER